ncbi:MBL fold metallo-hydrolase [Clostridium beijerinckii]|jgi:Predicted Zn-dependent hydrolases of the beta-lactamase fold|uniref:MBL fold metallo-hydrolase n=2 Tax=Clostridium beijerinckii TaxID=1520 RepID=A0AAE2RVD8_CLOBE|nr:MBL fold metallo-hydrolase [Clostridium beijerinckii]ABR34117.1 Zn-dependent hydrolase of the beta-lactamase fold-like protein [Clostridium beijerinckii NCIMB 8052]AIU00692.1 Zn-dependent hydrolase of the beta-lactamase fold-like protein [Clostridium beijerinckii ATCC 35702]MBF7811279.1 MBL fold metallo-hydrolase [Clostridium beijerinckii]NRT24587.1 L-ascorbate metabolism protein UlaG (beta-lactamase superfamily) [Clostridium beijerinckii]NRT67821.1 L-ascorbate metabolism protein UlaG (beta
MKTGIELIKDIDECILEKGDVAFWWLGQLGYAIKIAETTIYLDAFLSDWPNRNIPPLLKPEEIVNADFIIGTHDHSDHIDRDVWHQLSISSPNAKFVVPKLLITELSDDLKIPKNRFIGLDDGLSISEKDLKISAIPSAHEFLDQDSSGHYPYLGYIIEGNGCTVYHSGDTCMYDGIFSKLRQWNNFDIMFLPINGRDAKRYRENLIGNITYQEAVDLAGTIKPNLVVPGHYEMFDNNSENPILFYDYLNAKYPGIKCWIGDHGEMVKICKANK